MNAGLIGFGRLGRLLARHFARDARIFVHDSKRKTAEIRAVGATPATLAEACAQPVVVLCVPISQIEPLAKRIRGLLRPGALVVDACSVKERPLKTLKKILPRGVQILGSHPNFGPDSAADSLKGRKIVLCRVRVSGAVYARVRRALTRKGLEIVELTPREHDRRMAHSLVLTHFIGRGLVAYGAKATGVDTEGYKRLLRILETVQNDTWRLFVDMNRYNAHAAPMRRRFLAALARTDRRVRA